MQERQSRIRCRRVDIIIVGNIDGVLVVIFSIIVELRIVVIRLGKLRFRLGRRWRLLGNFWVLSAPTKAGTSAKDIAL